MDRQTAYNRYAALNDELTRNEQRHFGEMTRLTDALRDSFAAASPESNWTQAEDSSRIGTANDTKGYMHRSSAFSMGRESLSRPSSETSFLEWYPMGDATITFQNAEKKLQSIHHLNVDIIAESSVVLALAFEDSRSGPRLYLETLTSTTAYPFLRFLYTGTYALNGADGDFYEDVPTSILHHCQLYHLGDIHQLEELRTQAYVNVIRQCEFGCSSPDKPIDLCAGIRYVYRHLPKHKRLINTILDYCVSCFLRHRLGQDEEFKKLAYELRAFHQDLGMNSRDRGFDHEAAAAIIQLPYEPYIPDTYASRDDVLANRFDDVFHFHDDIDSSPKKRKRPDRFTRGIAEASKSQQPPSQELPIPAEHLPMYEEREYKFGSKRRASSAAGCSAPLPIAVFETGQRTLPLRPHPESSLNAKVEPDSEEELPKVRKSETPVVVDNTASSNTEFEIINEPPALEEMSDSDSDSSTLVVIKHEDADPLAHQAVQTTLRVVNPDLLDDSDSEWQVL